MASALRSRLRARLSGQALVLAGVLVVGVLLLVACGGGAQPAAAPAPVQATAAPVSPTEPPTAAPTATLAPSATPEPTATATAEPSPTAVVIADASNCVACHTSEETLQKLAKEEAPAEKLSEGEG